MFFITSIHFKDDIRSQRTFGYFADHDEAHRCITNNTGDLEERLYNYLVIEDVPEGIHPMPVSECWFKWDEENKLWQSCDAPDFSRHIINWCLG